MCACDSDFECVCVCVCVCVQIVNGCVKAAVYACCVALYRGVLYCVLCSCIALCCVVYCCIVFCCIALCNQRQKQLIIKQDESRGDEQIQK